MLWRNLSNWPRSPRETAHRTATVTSVLLAVHWAPPAALACSGRLPAKAGTAGSRCASFINRQTDAREIPCFLATVTHIMGIRAFTSQLLCEQVVGRGLRRTSYETDPTTFFTPSLPVVRCDKAPRQMRPSLNKPRTSEAASQD